MVTDDELGFFYVGEEDTAVHKYYADPEMSAAPIYTFALVEDGYSRDREGISLFNYPDGTGYFIVVDQGDASNQIASILRIYERQGDNKFVKTVAILDMEGKPMWDQDGVDSLYTTALPGFPNGIVIGHDGANSTYTIYDWKDIAGEELNIYSE
jgi:3-phytase